MNEIKLYKAPWKSLKLVLGSTIFVLLGVWGLRNNMPDWVAWSSIVFFGLGIPMGLLNLVDRRPQIIINEVGIFDRTVHNDFINWEIIQDSYSLEISGQHFICLVINESFKPSLKKGFVYKKATKLNELIGAQELNISFGQINVNTERLNELIQTLKGTSGPSNSDSEKYSLHYLRGY